MVVLQSSLERPTQPQISTCKLNKGRYIGALFNYFNHPAASNMRQNEKLREKWYLGWYRHRTAVCILFGPCL